MECGKKLNAPLIAAARRIAYEAHLNQKRANGVTPYVVHPQAVAGMLHHYGCDDSEIIAAAWVHDVVEDTEYTLLDLADLGERVCNLVDQLTKKNGQSNEEYWEAMCGDAALVKVADRLHNLLDSYNANYSDGRREWYLRNTQRMLDILEPKLPVWSRKITGRIHEEMERQVRECLGLVSKRSMN